MTTIFYTNSYGITAQWNGEVIAFDETSISIRFSKNKAFKYRLKDLDIDFVLVTKHFVKDKYTDSPCISSFDKTLQERIILSQKNNTAMLWTGKEWLIS